MGYVLTHMLNPMARRTPLWTHLSATSSELYLGARYTPQTEHGVLHTDINLYRHDIETFTHITS